MKNAIYIIGLLLFSSFAAHSQGGHYWTQQYGTRSMLLSGSVIGGVSDLGAVYYNPARLGFIENPAFLLSADVYEWSRLKFDEAFGNNVNFNKSSFDGVPSLAAGTFKVGFLPNHHFAYAVLSRVRSNLSFNYREELTGDVVENWPGDEIFEGEVGLDARDKEEWMGGSWSHALNEKVSLGASGFLVIGNSNKGTMTDLRALDSANNVATYTFNRNFSFNYYSLVWKFAAAFQLKNVDLGITVTAPSLLLKGNGSYNYQYYFSGLEGVSTTDDIYANSYQNNFRVKNKSPLAVGVGSTFNMGKSKLHISAEYYNKVAPYTIFKAADHAMQSDPDSLISFELVDELKSIINAGIGFEWAVSDKVSWYASFSTDFSAAVDETISFFQNKPEINNNTLKADFYNFGGGIVLKFKGADITLGATHTGSKQEIPRPISFPDEGNSSSTDDIFDPEETARLSWSRWRFVFSFSVPFLKDYAEDKLEKFEEKRRNK